MKNLFTAALLLTAQVASAEAIRLNGGSIEVFDVLAGDAVIDLKAPNFSFFGGAQNAYVGAADCVFLCSPGETLNLQLQSVGNDTPGIASFDGQEFLNVGDYNSNSWLTLKIWGSTTLPYVVRSESRTITKIVRVTGSFVHVEIPLAYVATAVRGSALATIELARGWFAIDEAGWYVKTLTYDIIRQRWE